MGMVIEYQNKLWLVLKHEIRTPGNLRAFNQVEMRDVMSGNKTNVRFNSGESIDRVSLDEKKFQYLYSDADGIHIMDQESYEQTQLPADILGERAAFLQDGMMLNVQLYEGKPIAVTLPPQITLEITETEPVVKGQTAASSYKPAMLENGVRVMVPPFIGTGDKIVVRTEDSSYVERAKAS
jgi:elongation factor P